MFGRPPEGRDSALYPQHPVQLAAAVKSARFVKTTDRVSIDENLRYGPSTREPFHFFPARRIVSDIYFFKFDTFRAQQGLGAVTIGAIVSGIDENSCHTSQLHLT